MILYITFLRAIASAVITNSHYTGIYPTDLIANGGLLGDVLFFAVSGFALANIKMSFLRWYTRRIVRIYPVVWIITAIYLLLGLYSFNELNFAQYFLYPTYYHFIASIVFLYIPFYFVMKIEKLRVNINWVMLGVFIIQLIVYLLFYDKTIYHIDNVRQPMIRFLFFETMLLGAYFRINDKKYKDIKSLLSWIIMFILIGIYFSSKMVFVKYNNLSQFQIINQFILFTLLYFILRSFASIDNALMKLPIKIKSIVSFIANITLEIYLVQYVIVPNLSHLIFPLNWFIITFLIVLVAWILNRISRILTEPLSTGVDKLFSKDRAVKK